MSTRKQIGNSSTTPADPHLSGTIGRNTGKPVTLQDVFGDPTPREDMLQYIRNNPDAAWEYDNLRPEDRERILAYLCGERSLQILSDKFFKKILDPSAVPERMESLLSAIYDEKVEIEAVLPPQGVMIQEGSQVVMDVLVRIAGGETVDIEMQRIGYLFPGERTSCYLADMIIRQYEKTRGERGKDFSYRDMKPVNLIVIMDQSTEEFHKTAPEYLHRQETCYSSGLIVTTLEHVTYISLDTFRQKTENKMEGALDAWLTFFTAEEPSDVLALINRWPMFLSMYQDIAAFRKNPEEVISMFSEALRIMDRNTTKYWIDSLKQEHDAMIQENAAVKQENDNLRRKAENLEQTNADLEEQLAEYRNRYGVL
ncbi:MAG: PD-(D/E)XK nuclease family transposase [Lachnospiraceae bacterium]|nr:PD-(D/E)XK nuclease family transposase [Lachnospiraceae bacterium]